MSREAAGWRRETRRELLLEPGADGEVDALVDRHAATEPLEDLCVAAGGRVVGAGGGGGGWASRRGACMALTASHAAWSYGTELLLDTTAPRSKQPYVEHSIRRLCRPACSRDVLSFLPTNCSRSCGGRATSLTHRCADQRRRRCAVAVAVTRSTSCARYAKCGSPTRSPVREIKDVSWTRLRRGGPLPQRRRAAAQTRRTSPSRRRCRRGATSPPPLRNTSRAVIQTRIGAPVGKPSAPAACSSERGGTRGASWQVRPVDGGRACGDALPRWRPARPGRGRCRGPCGCRSPVRAATRRAATWR